MFNFGKFWESTRRIFTVAKKPDMDEFKVMSKVTGLGIILIGIIGFVIMFFFIMLGIK